MMSFRQEGNLAHAQERDPINDLLNVFQVVLKKHKKFSIPAVTFTNGLTSNIVVKLPVSSNCSTEK